MPAEAFHRFELEGRRFAIDPETCFCFECDEIAWDVLGHYPQSTVNQILHDLGDQYEPAVLREVVGELEWLRATRSILKTPEAKDFMERFKVERGLRRLVVCLPEEAQRREVTKKGWFGKQTEIVSNQARELGRVAVGLLLSRSGDQKDLTLEFLEKGRLGHPALVADLCGEALKLAKLAGKNLSAVVHVAEIPLKGAPKALEGHAVSVKLEFAAAEDISGPLKNLRSGTDSLSALAKALQLGAAGVTGRIVVRPGHPDFGGVVQALHKAGFKTIELDLDGAYIAHKDADNAAMLAGLSQSAHYYAEQLLRNKFFRLDPIAALFHQIHEGTPIARQDPAGTNELAIGPDGGVYPSWRMLGAAELQTGTVTGGVLDEDLLRTYDDVGSLTTGPCRTCWARNLCGGGTAAVHYALTGSVRRPHDSWCDMQRSWMASAIAAFNLLASNGVNFSRIYQTLGMSKGGAVGKKMGMLEMAAMARAAMRLTIMVRPIEESDAEMLVKWENWNEATYFTCHPGGVLMATQYDREMDALHPNTLEQELIVTRRDSGDPIGLIKVGPDLQPGVAKAWVYLHGKDLYADKTIRDGFRVLISETVKRLSMRRVTAQAADREPALHGFLEAVGFSRAGVMREALFLHGARHDVSLFVLDVD